MIIYKNFIVIPRANYTMESIITDKFVMCLYLLFIFLVPMFLYVVILKRKYNKLLSNAKRNRHNKVKTPNTEEIITNNSNSTKSPEDVIIDKFTETYNKPVKTPYIIGICGASGSGKSFIAKVISEIIRKMFPKTCAEIVIISQDSYYKGGDADTNYDIPAAIDFDLLVSHIQKLIYGESIECPTYDFSTHSRKKETKTINPCKIIIVEGILIFTQEELRDLFNMKIFIDTATPTQIFRRIHRDQNERGRNLHEIWQRYERDVWPSYSEHVAPSSKFADIIINNFNNCYVGPQIVLSHIINILRNICHE
ncbi:uridine kinase [Tupanvirus soda lake]|uniref:uridine/cytidine kinase n=2 Tax=Tupanvirus TaxID=2094720 RepID=A0A6N1NVK6_9VIRU|nr:uridine kinase [Tupanvirus soda lake]QKU35428.1 uridine kinase [Tupanvirus soda lake]